MGGKRRFEAAAIMPTVQWLVESLADVCQWIEVAGSIRRGKEWVGDVELVVIPRTETQEVRVDLFTHEDQTVCLLEKRIRELEAEGYVRPRLNKLGRHIAWVKDSESRFVALEWLYNDHFPIDVFIVRQDRMAWWGWHLLLRTGPGAANKVLVTDRRKRGLKPSNVYIDDGKVWRDGALYPLKTETDVFSMYGMRFVPPEYRSAGMYNKVYKADREVHSETD